MHTLNEHMKEFILAEQQTGKLIFDIDKTAECLYKALDITAKIAFRKGIIVITRCKQNSSDEPKAKRGRGRPKGTKNAKNTLSTEYIICSDKEDPDPDFDFLWKNSSTDPRYISRYPDLIIYLNTLDSIVEGQKAILEANDLSISTVGVVNTDCSPNAITYPIPGNNDNPEALDLYYKLFKEAILRGNSERDLYYHFKETWYCHGHLFCSGNCK